MRIYPLADEALASPPHDWDSAHAQFDAGKNDGFVRAYAGPAEGQCMGYYVREHLPVLYSLADQYTVCDRWFSSVMGSTWPNRFYLHAATSLGIRGIQPIAVGGPPTLWDRMRERCLSCRNYSAGPLSWYSGGFAGKTLAGDNPTAKIESFFSDAQAGTLPNFSLIDPDFHLNDDHPPRNIKFGQAFLASIYQALAASPQWSRSLLLIIYDEHGGFYDHVPPPQAVDDLPDFRQLGFRVPALVIGPTARRGAVDSTVREHVSVAATLATRFGIESLTPRMDAAADLSSCVDPTLAVRPPPTVPRVQVTAGEVAGVQVRSSQPELDRLVLAGQMLAVGSRSPAGGGAIRELAAPGAGAGRPASERERVRRPVIPGRPTPTCLAIVIGLLYSWRSASFAQATTVPAAQSTAIPAAPVTTSPAAQAPASPAAPRPSARVVALRGGWLFLRSLDGTPLRPGDRFEVRAQRPVRVPDLHGSHLAPSNERRGGFVVERAEGDLGSGRLPKGTLAEVGDLALPTDEPPRPAVFLSPQWHGMTRVTATARPFINLLGPGYGLLFSATADRYFSAPFRLGVEVAPLGLIENPEGTGAVAHLRGVAAYTGDYFEVGVAAGMRLQRFGQSGFSVAALLRLGSLDGLSLSLENAYVLSRDTYTGNLGFALASFSGEINLPITARLQVQLAGGYGVDEWAYGTVGLRHYLRGGGGPGTLILSAAFGGVWVTDQATCRYDLPDPCQGMTSTWGFGLTTTFGFDLRF